MQKLLVAAALLAGLVATDAAQAAQRVRYTRVQRGPVYQDQSYRPGPFARLMELERRKNERLRQMFWGY